MHVTELFQIRLFYEYEQQKTQCFVPFFGVCSNKMSSQGISKWWDYRFPKSWDSMTVATFVQSISQIWIDLCNKNDMKGILYTPRIFVMFVKTAAIHFEC